MPESGVDGAHRSCWINRFGEGSETCPMRGTVFAYRMETGSRRFNVAVTGKLYLEEIFKQ